MVECHTGSVEVRSSNLLCSTKQNRNVDTVAIRVAVPFLYSVPKPAKHVVSTAFARTAKVTKGVLFHEFSRFSIQLPS